MLTNEGLLGFKRFVNWVCLLDCMLPMAKPYQRLCAICRTGRVDWCLGIPPQPKASQVSVFRTEFPRMVTRSFLPSVRVTFHVSNTGYLQIRASVHRIFSIICPPRRALCTTFLENRSCTACTALVVGQASGFPHAEIG